MVETNKAKDWSPAALAEALKAGSTEDKLDLLKEAGILTASGEVAPLYRNWGSKPSYLEDSADEESGIE